MAYSSASQVAGLCANILGGASNFSASSSPNLTLVENWLSSGCGLINSTLNAYGYETPVTQGAAPNIYDELTLLNTLYAATWVEMSRTNVTLSLGERTRGQVFNEEFKKGLNSLVNKDLTRAGLSRSSQGIIYVGGIDIDQKDAYDDDTSRVQPRFKRGFARPDYISEETTAS